MWSAAVKRRIIKTLLIVVTTIAVAGAILFAVLSAEQERLVNLAVRELNKQFRGELTVEGSSISLFKNFPYVSVVLHNGHFYADKQKQGAPIYEFDQLYIGFSVSDLLHENYSIKIASIDGGYLHMIQEPDGKINLVEAETAVPDTTQSQPDNEVTGSLTLDLQKIVLQNMAVSFEDKANQVTYNTQVEYLTSTLKMESSLLAFAVKSDMKLGVTTANDTTTFRNKNFYLDIVADYDMKSELFKIFNSHFKIEDARFNVAGEANFADTTDVNFRVKGDKQDFNMFRAFLPEHVKQSLEPFQYDGRLHFDASVKGKITETKDPLIEVVFACEDAWFLNKEANKKVDQLGFKGFYTNGHEHSLSTSEIHIVNVTARPEKGIFKGHFVIRDFTRPQAVVKINSELELQFLGEFLGIADLKQITGKIKLDMNFKELHDIQLPEESLNKLKEGIESRLSVENLTFNIPGYPLQVTDMNVIAEMDDGRVTIDTADLKIGDSDIEFKGTISDVRTFLRDQHNPISMALKISSDQILLAKLLSYDTALARKHGEEIHKFNIDLKFETTVTDLLNPSPLPRGTFEIQNLRGVMKNYGHTLKNLNARLVINDTLLRLQNFTGVIDSTDLNVKGRIVNYHLWFDEIKKGKTEIAFDFKSNRFAMKDVFTREVRALLPRGYRREQLNNVWLRSKMELRYDTIFRFAKGRIANVTADLQRHKLKLKDISGGFKYGSKILAFDTLRGIVGNSDFDMSLKYYFLGIDRYNKKVNNTLTFNSKFLDIDEISRYDLAPRKGTRSRRDSAKTVAVAVVDSSGHAHSFNIFTIPFSDFDATINIAKIKFSDVFLDDVIARIAMKQDQTITLDTLTLKVADGAIRMRGKFNGQDHQKIYFRSRIVFDKVDLEKMLLKLDHMGQDVVVNKNLKGTISGSIRSNLQVHPNLVPIVSTSRAEMELSIYNGSLVEFAPMLALASYFKDKNLHHIRFDTLQNKLTYSNGVLEIPAMDINSSLGFIQMSGKQSLDMNMEYYLRVPMKLVTKASLGTILNRKPDEIDINQIDEIDYSDKDRRLAFMNLKVTGTPDNFKVGLGKDRKREN